MMLTLFDSLTFPLEYVKLQALYFTPSIGWYASLFSYVNIITSSKTDTEASVLSSIPSVLKFPPNLNLTALCPLEKTVISLSAPEAVLFF